MQGTKNQDAIGLLEMIIQVLNMIIQEYLHVNNQSGGSELASAPVLLDHNYVSAFLATVQDRVEFVYA